VGKTSKLGEVGGYTTFELYERAVTGGSALARFLVGLHGKRPTVLAEDFSGSAALARAWVKLSPAHKAVAIDRDRAALDAIPPTPRLTVRRQDVLEAKGKVDIIAATNFPIGYWHTRGELLKYLRACRGRLKRGGVFVADLYGGPSAWRVHRRSTSLKLEDGGTLVYTWDQQSADGLTGKVRNAIHFRVQPRNGRAVVHKDAFTYDWRLWSIPELRDAMDEAGFRVTEVHDRLGAAIDHLGNVHTRPVEEGELDEDYVVYVAARV
jgi:SAM-dependent methyltransferase